MFSVRPNRPSASPCSTDKPDDIDKVIKEIETQVLLMTQNDEKLTDAAGYAKVVNKLFEQHEEDYIEAILRRMLDSNNKYDDFVVRILERHLDDMMESDDEDERGSISDPRKNSRNDVPEEHDEIEVINSNLSKPPKNNASPPKKKSARKNSDNANAVCFEGEGEPKSERDLEIDNALEYARYHYFKDKEREAQQRSPWSCLTSLLCLKR